MSFYRTYRPQIIDEIDNIAVRAALTDIAAKKKADLPHAFLFSGPRGGGKTTAARVLAKIFNCEKPGKKGPCGDCAQCVSIAAGKNLDVFELDAASNRGIDEIRSLRDGIALAPVGGTYKVYIIDEVHMLTTEAFNALLKTLEEPPMHAVFVLATTDPQKVPVTIVSRCTHIRFTKATSEELVHALMRIVHDEHMQIEDDAVALIAGAVDGSFRDGVKLLEQAGFHEGPIDVSSVQSLLSMVAPKDIEDFLAAVTRHDVASALSTVEHMNAKGQDMKNFLIQVLHVLHRLLIASPQDSGIQEQIHAFARAYEELKVSAIAQLPIELAVVDLCAHASQTPVTEEKKENPDGESKTHPEPESSDMLTVEKLAAHWPDIIAALKPLNHSVAAVLRSTRPATVANGIVTIEAFYTFHKDKLTELKTREIIGTVLKKLFGETVKVDVILGKK